jgi:hypothetical protein
MKPFPFGGSQSTQGMGAGPLSRDDCCASGSCCLSDSGLLCAFGVLGDSMSKSTKISPTRALSCKYSIRSSPIYSIANSIKDTRMCQPKCPPILQKIRHFSQIDGTPCIRSCSCSMKWCSCSFQGIESSRSNSTNTKGQGSRWITGVA